MVGDKHDFAGVNLLTGAAETDNKKLQDTANGMVKYAQNLALQINDSVKSTNTSLRSLSDTLGISTKPLDDYRHSINLVSESGKALTDAQIGQEIANISDEMVRKLMPAIDDFSKSGETSVQTFSRLANQFDVLTNAAGLLFGKTASASKSLINQVGFKDQTAFLDKAGGTDAFAAMVSGFAQKFLSDDQRMRPVIESLVTQRDKLGLSSINSRDQYVSAVQSGKLNSDQLIFLLKNQDSINQVFTYLEKIGQVAPTAASGLDAVSKQLKFDFTNVYDTIAAGFEKQIQGFNDSLEKLKDFSRDIAGFVQQLQPMSRNEALQQLLDYATAAKKGADLPDINTLRAPISVLTNMNTNDYASQIDYARAKAQSVDLISSFIDISKTRQTKLEQYIQYFKEYRDYTLSTLVS